MHKAIRARSPGRRSQAESERTKRRILERAEHLFARCGFRGVSLRELARHAGVQPFTIQHHFGSKLALYQAVISRWGDEIRARLVRIVEHERDLTAIVEGVVDELFEFSLSHRDWLVITARAALGEGLPQSVARADRGWVRFMDESMRRRGLGALKLDPGLFLITVEGMLNHHVLSRGHYRALYGSDVTEPQLKARTKRHLKRVILTLVEAHR